jgi:large subunit ribosomal protein L21
VTFGEVLMLGDGAAVTVGAPTVAGASVAGTLVETRKGDKVKIFKKIRRQNYRRTRGHRQMETVVRVTSVAGGGKTDKWDGTVDLTPRALLNARARGLKNLIAELEGAPAPAKAKAAAAAKPAAAKPAVAKPAPAKAEAAAATEAKPVKAAAPKAEAKTEAAPKEAAAPKATAPKAAAPKAAAKTEAKAEAKAPAKKPAAKKKD